MTRFGIVLTTYATALFAAASCFVRPAPMLLWNATPSAPIGLYAVRAAAPLQVGELVVVRPPPMLARWLADRRYLATGAPLVKHIAALPGAEVCRGGAIVTVDGTPLSTALDRDRFGRPLPIWQGCRVLSSGQLFFLNPARPDSLDGRYFGALPIKSVVGRAFPLWIIP